MLFCLADRANTEEFKLVGGDLVPGGLFDLGGDPVNKPDIWIDNGLAAGADQVRMGVGLLPVVAISVSGEPDFQDFAELFQQIDCFVNGGKACGGEIHFDLLEDLFHTRMLVTVQENLEDGDPLRGDAKIMFSESQHNFFEAQLCIFHGSPATADNRN